MGHAPENTTEAFEKAIALGCDELETDVWLMDPARSSSRMIDRRPLPRSHRSLTSWISAAAGSP